MDNTNRNTKGWSSVVGGRMQEHINNFREYLNPLSWVDHWYSSTSNSTAMYNHHNKPESKLNLELWEESGLRQNIPLWDVGSRSVHSVDVYQQPCRSALINMASDMLLQYVCKQTSPSPYRLAGETLAKSNLNPNAKEFTPRGLLHPYISQEKLEEMIEEDRLVNQVLKTSLKEALAPKNLGSLVTAEVDMKMLSVNRKEFLNKDIDPCSMLKQTGSNLSVNKSCDAYMQKSTLESSGCDKHEDVSKSSSFDAHENKSFVETANMDPHTEQSTDKQLANCDEQIVDQDEIQAGTEDGTKVVKQDHFQNKVKNTGELGDTNDDVTKVESLENSYLPSPTSSDASIFNPCQTTDTGSSNTLLNQFERVQLENRMPLLSQSESNSSTRRPADCLLFSNQSGSNSLAFSQSESSMSSQSDQSELSSSPGSSIGSFSRNISESSEDDFVQFLDPRLVLSRQEKKSVGSASTKLKDTRTDDDNVEAETDDEDEDWDEVDGDDIPAPEFDLEFLSPLFFTNSTGATQCSALSFANPCPVLSSLKPSSASTSIKPSSASPSIKPSNAPSFQPCSALPSIQTCSTSSSIQPCSASPYNIQPSSACPRLHISLCVLPGIPCIPEKKTRKESKLSELRMKDDTPKMSELNIEDKEVKISTLEKINRIWNSVPNVARKNMVVVQFSSDPDTLHWEPEEQVDNLKQARISDFQTRKADMERMHRLLSPILTTQHRQKIYSKLYL